MFSEVSVHNLGSTTNLVDESEKVLDKETVSINVKYQIKKNSI